MGKSDVAKGLLDALADVVAKPTKKKPRLKPGDYVRDRQRMAFPGIYGRPDEIAAEAARRVAPEDPALQRLFGVTRDDLYGMAQDTPRDAPTVLSFKPGSRGAYSAENIQTDRNQQRLIDTLGEAASYPELTIGMDSWYNMDPVLTRMRELTSTPEADFAELNAYLGLASPGTNVIDEMKRGAGARYMAHRGRFDEFADHGGMPNSVAAPEELRGMPGHVYHSTSQVPGMRALTDGRGMVSDAPKVPAYVQASLPAELGGSWNDVPVGDAHFSRAVGLADTRRGEAQFGRSITKPELFTLAPWWKKIAAEVGLPPVPAQARAWGTFSHATGVETPVGAPKLELLAGLIERAAAEKGVSPEWLRDRFLMGDDMLTGRHTGRKRVPPPTEGLLPRVRRGKDWIEGDVPW